MRSRLTPWVLLLLLAGCGPGSPPPTLVEPAHTLIEVFGSSAVIESIEKASSATAYRLPSPSGHQPLLDDFEMSAGPMDVPDKALENLQVVLLDTSTYGWDFAKGCVPDYGVRIHFEWEQENVDVLFCFQCNILSVYHNGQYVGGEDFDDGRPQLTNVVQAIFPDDAEIQSLAPDS